MTLVQKLIFTIASLTPYILLGYFSGFFGITIWIYLLSLIAIPIIAQKILYEDTRSARIIFKDIIEILCGFYCMTGFLICVLLWKDIGSNKKEI